MALLPDYIPTYIRQNITAAPKEVITAARWNELFNLVITQGDNTTDDVVSLLTALAASTAAASIGADVPTVVTKTVQGVLTAFEAALADRYTKNESNALVTTNTNDLVKSITFNDMNGTFTITKKDNSVVTIDTLLEKVPVSMVFETVGNVTRIKLINQDGSTSSADVSALVDNYTFGITDTIAMGTSGVGNQKTVTATLRDGSITLPKLALDSVTQLESYRDAAANSATAASNSATIASTAQANASSAANNASFHASAASTARTAAAASAAEALTSKTDAAASAADALTSKNTAITSASTATTKASEAATSATNANTSAGNANTAATTATTAAGTATTKASEASTSATNAANSATAASGSAQNANTSLLTTIQARDVAITNAMSSDLARIAASTSATEAAASAVAADASADAAADSAAQAAAIVGQKVATFNGRDGVVVPQAGDYTAAMVGASPAAHATATLLHKQGVNNTQSGMFANAEGGGTMAIGNTSHAEGESTRAKGNASHSEGLYTAAEGSASHSEGLSTLADGDGAHVEGSYNSALKIGAHAEGSHTSSVQGSYFKVMAILSDSSFTLETTVGLAVNDIVYAKSNSERLLKTKITSVNGNDITITIVDDIVGTPLQLGCPYFIKPDTDATKGHTHSEGYSTVATGNASHAEGSSTKAHGDSAHAEGYYTVASGKFSHAESQNTTASGESSHAEGELTVAATRNAHAEGKGSLAAVGSYYYATAIDDGAKTLTFADVTGLAVNDVLFLKYSSTSRPIISASISAINGSVVYLNTTESLVNYYYAVKATGAVPAHAEGSGTIASGSSSHAEGAYALATGGSSHAEGSNTKASGNSSHVEGQNSTASGTASHAEGSYTTAGGNFSHSQNNRTIAQGLSQTTLGEYNVAQGTATTKVATDHALIVGNGTADASRSNAMSLTWEGTLDVAKDVKVGSTTLLGVQAYAEGLSKVTLVPIEQSTITVLQAAPSAWSIVNNMFVSPAIPDDGIAQLALALEPGYYNVHYITDTEEGCDVFSVLVPNPDEGPPITLFSTSGSKTGDFRLKLENAGEGAGILILKYQKDGSSAEGTDQVKVCVSPVSMGAVALLETELLTKVPQTRTINGNPLVADVVLLASDVGATPVEHGTDATQHIGTDTKTTPVDADSVALVDSADSSNVKKLTWASLKNALQSVFAPQSHKSTDTTYGLGDATYCGHVKLKDTAGNNSVTSGIALTPKGLFDHAIDLSHIVYGDTTGAANTYAVTISSLAVSLVAGFGVAIKINTTNTGASTFDINTLGAKAIKTPKGLDVTAGMLVAGCIYTLRYNGTNFILQGDGSDVGSVSRYGNGANKISTFELFMFKFNPNYKGRGVL